MIAMACQVMDFLFWALFAAFVAISAFSAISYGPNP
jgi:hypothetical protein